MIEAALRVHLPCSWVTLLTQEKGSLANVVEQKDLGNGLLQSLVEIEAEGEPQAIIDALKENPDVVDLKAIVPPKGRILATLQVKDCRACHLLAESECFLTDATAAEDGSLVWYLLAPQREEVEALVQALKEQGLDLEVASIRDPRITGILTERQEKVVSLAYKLGYFEFPKRISLTELAQKVGVAKSTLSEILRTGEAKVLHAYFHGLMRRPR